MFWRIQSALKRFYFLDFFFLIQAKNRQIVLCKGIFLLHVMNCQILICSKRKYFSKFLDNVLYCANTCSVCPKQLFNAAKPSKSLVIQAKAARNKGRVRSIMKNKFWVFVSPYDKTISLCTIKTYFITAINSEFSVIIENPYTVMNEAK